MDDEEQRRNGCVRRRAYPRGAVADWPYVGSVEPQPIVVPRGEGHRVGNVEFLARTVDTRA
jgi:hypothetical protein